MKEPISTPNSLTYTYLGKEDWIYSLYLLSLDDND